jgi:DNA-binding response OmpR family regulator
MVDGALRVLIIDRHEDSRVLLGDLLSSRGHNCRAVEDLETALSELAALRPDAIIVEWYKGGKPDTELLEVLRRRATELGIDARLVVLSTLPDGQATADADGYLLKPAHLDDVEALIRKPA